MGIGYRVRVRVDAIVDWLNASIEGGPRKKLLVSLVGFVALAFTCAEKFYWTPKRERAAETRLAKLEGKHFPPQVRLSLTADACVLVNEDHRDVRQASIVFNDYLANGDGCAGPSITSSHQVPAKHEDVLRPRQRLVAPVPLSPRGGVQEPCDRTTCFRVIECEARFFRYDLQQGFVVSDYAFIGTAGVITMPEAVRRTVNAAMAPGRTEIVAEKIEWTDSRLERAHGCALETKARQKHREIIHSAVNPEPAVHPISED